MRKPENTFIAGVHKHLPRTVYAEKMANPYRGGTPDVWYSGSKRDLWVEYKYIPSIPKRANTPIVADLSALQKQWLEGRFSQGRNVAVIIGSPHGGVVLRNMEWVKPIPAEQFQAQLLPRPSLAAWIEGAVT